MSPPAPSAAVVAVQAAVAVLAACPASELAPDQAVVDLAALLQISDALARVRIDRLSDAQARSLHALDGARSAATWIAAHGQVAPAELAVARRLAVFPVVGSALLDGTLTVGAAHKLQAALGTLRPHLDAPSGLLDGVDAEVAVRNVVVDGVRMVVAQARGGFPTDDDPVLVLLMEELPRIAELPVPQLGRVERALVLLAQHVEPAQLPPALDLLLGALLPSRLEDAAGLGHARRSLVLSRDGDGTGWTLSGRLDLLTGERLSLALDAGMRLDPDNPLDTATAEQLRQQGHDPSDPALAPTLTPRSRRQRLHDALAAVLTGYLAADLAGVHDKNPVQVVVDVTLPALDGRVGALPARTGTGTLLPRSLGPRWPAVPRSPDTSSAWPGRSSRPATPAAPSRPTSDARCTPRPAVSARAPAAPGPPDDPAPCCTRTTAIPGHAAAPQALPTATCSATAATATCTAATRSASRTADCSAPTAGST